MTSYTFSAPPPDGGTLATEIMAAGLPLPAWVGYRPGIFGAQGSVTVSFADALTDPQQATLATVVAAHDNSPATQAARFTATLRDEAAALLSDPGSNPKLLRAVLLVVLDELNVLREWLASFKTTVAGATSLVDLKARVAGLPDTPDRTAAQARNAIAARISAGDADT